MKIWHITIVKALPRQLLLALHRDICALRGRSWGKAAKFMTWPQLYNYHLCIMDEMVRRGWNPHKSWRSPGWRGKRSSPIPVSWVEEIKKTRGTLPEFPTAQQTDDSMALQKWARKGRVSAEDYLRVLELFT